MRFMARLGVMFYNIVTLLCAVLLAMIALKVISVRDLNVIIETVYASPNVRLLIGLLAILLVLKAHFFARTIYGEQQKGRNIAFDNPAGRVSVSLSAVEDLIKRVVLSTSEVKEVRSSIVAGKKGLSVDTRLVLNTDTNIPEMTSRIQNLIQKKIQDVIGIEENIVVRVDVVKIALNDRSKKRSDQGINKGDSTVPFEGYRP